jgi:6-phospho-3-hexuloisomerase
MLGEKADNGSAGVFPWIGSLSHQAPQGATWPGLEYGRERTYHMTFREATATIVGEIGDALDKVSHEEALSLCDAIERASAVFVTGEGRSGLVGRCFAMRLMHLGVKAHVVGGTTTPRLGPDDLLLAISCTGETALTCTVARVSAEQGGKVIAVTAGERSTLASSADLTVVVPPSPSRQYGGSLFEQGALIVLDAVAMMLRERLGVSAEAMNSRHANLE